MFSFLKFIGEYGDTKFTEFCRVPGNFQQQHCEADCWSKSMHMGTKRIDTEAQ